MSFLLPSLVLAAHVPVLYYMFPLTAVIALVYSASRFEDPRAILQRAFRLFLQITLFLVVILILLYLLTVRL